MPELVGRYEIIEELGQGGFAVVYRGKDTMLNRMVALKELRHFLLQDDDWVKRFQLEARTIAQLDHPHIVPIYDILNAANRMFIVMRLTEGPSLEELLAAQGRLSWVETLQMISAIIKGLHYAHSRGVLHRDIKPANILIDDSRGPMLSDFGLARLNFDTRSQSQSSHSIFGTPNYIAPEIWEGHEATPQSDIYALGCTLFEMLTGEKLFQGPTPVAVMKAHFGPDHWPDLLPADLPDGVSHVLATALAKAPQRRFAGALEMLQALQQPGPIRSKVAAPAKPALAAAGPVLATKLYAPLVRQDLVIRPRLMSRMVDGLKQRSKLTLAAAPAGFGKSTLISCWLNALQEGRCRDGQSVPLTEPVKSVWFSLDENDNDPARFVSYIVAALQKINPDIGATLQKMPQLPPPETVASILINDLTAVDDRFVLVLDDYHLIGTAFVHQLIEFVIEHQPPQMHLVITTREDPPLPLPRLRAQGHIVEIRQDDLRFTAEEAATFLNQTMNLNLTPEAVAALENRTEGWIAGLQLAALSLQGRDAPYVTDFIQEFSGSHRYVIDYLVEEVIYQQPKNIRKFLRQTSILDRFSVPLCNAITGQPDSKLILSYLEQVNLFLIPLDDQRQWYRYHHLFAEFLQSELSTDQRTSLHLQAAHWFQANGLLAEAIEHALAAEEFDLAGQFINRAAENALRNGAFYTLAHWIDSVPEAVVRANPELATHKGWVSWLMGDIESSVSYARSAETVMPDNTSNLIRGKLLSLQACQAVSRESAGVELAKKALPLLEESDTFFNGMALLVLGEAQNLMGDTSGAVETLQYALRLGRKYHDHFMTIGALVNLAQQYNWQGKRRNAEALCWQAVEQSYDEKGRLLPMAGFSYITLAEVELHTGDLELTREHLQKGMAITDRYGMVGFSISGKLVLAPLQYALGHTEDAIETMQDVLRIVIEGDFRSYAAVTCAMEAELQLRAGNLAAVTEWAKTVTLPTGASFSLMREYELLVYVRHLLAAEDFQTAEALLHQIETSTRDNGRGLMLLLTSLLQAQLYAALDQPEVCAKVLTRAVKMACLEDYKHVFLQEGSALLTLLPRVRPVTPEFVDEVLRLGRQRGLLGEALPAATRDPAIQLLPEPLTEREIEVLQLIASGQSNKEAAESLVVTVGTVKKHLSNIFGKLGVSSRTQAVARARDLQLVE